MNYIKLATITALSSTILLSGLSASAQETREVETDGTIEFISDTDQELIVTPPEPGEPGEPGQPGPDEIVINPEVPGTTGPLSIIKAVTMDFGSQVISNQDQTYNMIAEMVELAEARPDGTTEVPYVSFAQVSDTRGSNAGWDLQVSLSDFTSNTQNNVLNGAQVALNDARIQYAGNNQNNAPTTQSGSIELIPESGSVSIMKADSGKGAGVSSVVWGNQADLSSQFEDESVDTVENSAIQVSIPGATAKDATTYTSNLSWELVTLPGEDGETVPEV
ncbi:WxL domain-containing protein [Marinilactibacillus kalidii]|uniref:WxL domain-containing protein n=1 Tax=Marinilactibacillus kalidii TaxID=2820274 RepID=UPI001ABDEB46|nr:WxL domain-containing protein [Marinilactibacillus kalidii]